MTNSTSTIMPGAVTATLNGSGYFTQSLASNDDAATLPQDTVWRVDIRIAGVAVQSYEITVPTNTASADLGSLLPTNPYGA
jgi:hypothetical protein